MPQLPTTKQLYDSIMGQIEPDLRLDIIPTLPEKYRNESPEALKERGQRYFLAFEKFKEMLDAKANQFKEQLDQLHHFVTNAFEYLSTEQDTVDRTRIEQLIQAL